MPATTNSRDLRTLSYADALATLRGRGSRRIAPNTCLELHGNLDIGVRLHETTIITIHANGNYTLNSGGYRTATTKQRINALSPAFVGQQRGQWWVGRRCPVAFTDGIVVNGLGDVVPAGPSPAQVQATVNTIKAEIASLAKQINDKRAELKTAQALLPVAA